MCGEKSNGGNDQNKENNESDLSGDQPTMVLESAFSTEVRILIYSVEIIERYVWGTTNKS